LSFEVEIVYLVLDINMLLRICLFSFSNVGLYKTCPVESPKRGPATREGFHRAGFVILKKTMDTFEVTGGLQPERN